MAEIQPDREGALEGQSGETPKLTDVRESIRYRRRAQEAERRCAALESEIEELRQSHAAQAGSLEDGLASERRERESLEHRLEQLQAERRLERELIRAGARDPETAMLVARERLATAGDADVDVEKLARDLLDEKPYLKAEHREEVPPLGRASQPARPSQKDRKGRTERLASAAKASGRRTDIVEYMRARRNRQ